VQVEHNMWGYVYLRHYLELKGRFQRTELTGQESYLLQLMNAHSIGTGVRTCRLARARTTCVV
jgi:hypothetical protein